MDSSFVNGIILPGLGRKYSGRSSKGLLWLQSSEGFFFPNHFIRKPSKMVMLYAHGNGGSLGDFKAIVSFYANWFCMSVLAIEYPGYGPAEGSPSEESVNDNFNTAFRFLRSLGYSENNIVLMGYSIGTGPVLQLASQLCTSGTPPGAVVTIAAFLSICDIIRDLKGAMILSMLADTIANRWNSAEMVTQITCPIMFIHGMQDDVIPYSHSQQLYDRCVSSAKYLRLCANATHKQFEEPVDTVEPMATFLTETVKVDDSIEIAPVPQFMYVCPHSVIETEKITRSAKKGGSAFSDVSSMYQGGEIACDVFGAVGAVANTLISLPMQFSKYTASIFANIPGNGVMTADSEADLQQQQSAESIKPFSPNNTNSKSSSDLPPKAKKAPKQVKISADATVMGDSIESSSAGVGIRSNPTTPRKAGEMGSMLFVMPNSPSLHQNPERRSLFTELDDSATEATTTTTSATASSHSSLSSTLSSPKNQANAITSSSSAFPSESASLAEEAKHLISAYYSALNQKDIPSAVELLDSNVVVRYPNPTKTYSGSAVAADRYRALFNTLPEFSANISFKDVTLEHNVAIYRIQCHITCQRTNLDKATEMIFIIKDHKIVSIEHKA